MNHLSSAIVSSLPRHYDHVANRSMAAKGYAHPPLQRFLESEPELSKSTPALDALLQFGNKGPAPRQFTILSLKLDSLARERRNTEAGALRKRASRMIEAARRLVMNSADDTTTQSALPLLGRESGQRAQVNGESGFRQP